MSGSYSRPWKRRWCSAIAVRSSGTPGPGGYWLPRPSRRARTAASLISSGPSVSGKPWPRLIEPVLRASADISAKIVVPNSASLRLSSGRGPSSPAVLCVVMAVILRGTSGVAQVCFGSEWPRASPCHADERPVNTGEAVTQRRGGPSLQSHRPGRYPRRGNEKDGEDHDVCRVRADRCRDHRVHRGGRVRREPQWPAPEQQWRRGRRLVGRRRRGRLRIVVRRQQQLVVRRRQQQQLVVRRRGRMRRRQLTRGSWSAVVKVPDGWA
ncbi:hypothetical protein RKD30_003766 [Streptomyces pristinaespiralis]